jgi:sarcosine oxidase
MKHDIAVIGLGAMGSAALCQLARRGVRTIGIERYAPGHDRGSSHGETRIIRLGYFEHPSYVPLLRRTYALWRDLETAAKQKFVHITGIVEIGPSDGELVAGTLAASRMHGLPHDVLNAAEVMRRFPAFQRLPSNYGGVVQPDGGFVAVEPAITAQIRLAEAAGAEVRSGITVYSVAPRGDGVRISTSGGDVQAASAIIAAGPWVTALKPSLPVRVTRQVFGWFAPSDPAQFSPECFPVFLLQSRHGMHYGFPQHGRSGVKIAKHHHRDETVDPERVERAVTAADEALIRPMLAEHIPALNGVLLAAKTCLYTVTPDHDFIIDRLPDAPNIIVASPCSGHGFKFAPVVGEILAQLAIEGATEHDISRFRLARFAERSPACTAAPHR